jgi:hypothetical protein
MARLDLRNTAPVLDPTGLWEVIVNYRRVIMAIMRSSTPPKRSQNEARF